MFQDERLFPIESILRSWLEDPEITVFCGHWDDGAVMELLPGAGLTLSGPHYPPPFDGVRELRLKAAAHHVHLDLSRLERAWYLVTPSVCFGYRPSFELRLTRAGQTPGGGFSLGLALAKPYQKTTMRADPVRRYLLRAALHIGIFPHVVAMYGNRASAGRDTTSDWAQLDALLDETEHHEGISMQLVREALHRGEAPHATP
jgi:hypothetical protein